MVKQRYNDAWKRNVKRNGPLGPSRSLQDHESGVKSEEEENEGSQNDGSTAADQSGSE